MLHAFFQTLQPSVTNLTDFEAIKRLQFFLMKLSFKSYNIFKIHKVDKSVTEIAVIVQIHGQVEKVIGVLEFLIDPVHELNLIVFIRDI